MRECRCLLCLTLLVGCEKDAEAAFAAGLVRPHADDAQRGNQHDVVGHRGAELALQIFHRTEMRQGEIRIHSLLSSSMVISCAFQLSALFNRSTEKPWLLIFFFRPIM